MSSGQGENDKECNKDLHSCCSYNSFLRFEELELQYSQRSAGSLLCVWCVGGSDYSIDLSMRRRNSFMWQEGGVAYQISL